MARIARVVAPGIPHHVTQRGNGRQQTFYHDEDYQAYLELMSEWCAKRNVQIWAYCLMPSDVHLIAVPETKDSLNLAIVEAHKRYTQHKVPVPFRPKVHESVSESLYSIAVERLVYLSIFHTNLLLRKATCYFPITLMIIELSFSSEKSQ